MLLWQQALEQIYGERLLMTCNCIQSNFLNPWGFVILVHCPLLLPLPSAAATALCCQCPPLSVSSAVSALYCLVLSVASAALCCQWHLLPCAVSAI